MHATGRRRDIERHWRSRRGPELPVHAPDLSSFPLPAASVLPATLPSAMALLRQCRAAGASHGQPRVRDTPGRAHEGVARGRDIRQPHACPDQPPPFFPRERGRGAKIFPPGATRFSQSREMRKEKNPATETKGARH
ncbi:hypothetical protein E2C01_061274 [Portunus trituberculatus]|uniref:Uncharacterized protein n=1 Tax=Portunus trituberculatus TaxID=210409 RepID=A0A5B7HB85_PORTR|nr:hypothetical protein [Portunus trituberculatus]